MNIMVGKYRKESRIIDDRFTQYSYYCASIRKKFRLLFLIRRFFSLLLRKYYFDGEISGLIFFLTTKRNDHTRLFKAAYDSAHVKKNLVKLSYRKGLNFNFFFLYAKKIREKKLFRDIRLYDESLNEKYFVHKTSFYERSWMYIDYIEYLLYDEIIKKIDFSKCSGCVVLHDTCHPERNLVRKFNKIGIPSITLCHGIFNPHIDYRQESFLNYWNSDASYSLTWGRGTAELFSKYSNAKTIVCGNPLINVIKSDSNNGYIGIVMSVGSLYKDNQNMINIVQSFAKINGYKIHIRIHPGDDKKRYTLDDSLCFFEDNLDDDLFIVCHTSAMLYMYLAQGKKVLKYFGSTPTYSVDDQITFNTLGELEIIISKLDNINFSKISKKEIEYIGEESSNRYSKAFNAIVKVRKVDDDE